MTNIQIHQDELYFKNYPFEPSFVYKNKTIVATQIEAIYIHTFVTSLKIEQDLVFVPKMQEEDLKAFAIRNNILIGQRNTNWEWLTIPFLDTELSVSQEKKAWQRLLNNGFSEDEIHFLRQTITKPLWIYNAIRDVYSLSLYDVLMAVRPRYRKENFYEFYWEAMEIEQRKASI